MIIKSSSTPNKKFLLPEIQPKMRIGPKTKIFPPQNFKLSKDEDNLSFTSPKYEYKDLKPASSAPFLDHLIEKYANDHHVQFVDLASKVQRIKPQYFSWIQKRTYGNIPSSRAGATLTPINNEFYLFGGQSGDRLNELKCLNYSTLTWKTINPVKDMETPDPRDGHTTLAFRHYLVVYGGAGAFNSALHTRTCSPLLHLLDTQSLHWKIYKPIGRLPDPRRNHGASIVGNSMIIYGGINNNSEVLEDFQAVNIDLMQWFTIKFTKDTEKPHSRHSFTMTNVYHSNTLKQSGYDIFNMPGVFDEDFTRKNSGIYIFGGMNEQRKVLNDLYLFQPVKKQAKTDKNLVKITKLEPAGKPPLARYQHSAGLCGKFLVVIGGRNDSLYVNSKQSAVSEIAAFNVPCFRWETIDLSGNVTCCVWGIACAALNSKLLCFGGMNLNSFASNDLWVLETNQDFGEGQEYKKKENIRIVIRRSTRVTFQ